MLGEVAAAGGTSAPAFSLRHQNHLMSVGPGRERAGVPYSFANRRFYRSGERYVDSSQRARP